MKDKDVAIALKRARMKANLRQEDLAAKVGMTRTAISKTESGARALRAAELLRIAQVIEFDFQLPQMKGKRSPSREARPIQVDENGQCNCLELVEAELKKNNTEIEGVQSLDSQTGEFLPRRICLSTFKSDPNDRRKAMKLSLTNKFCHFCGKGRDDV